MSSYPWINPVLIKIGFIEIRWYSIAYLLGFLCAVWFAKKIITINKDLYKNSISHKNIDDFLTYAVLGVILGGRIGYVLIYNLNFYLENPNLILKIWNGGMSFHGGLVGYIISMSIFCKIKKINILKFADLFVIGAICGIMFGRIANFINGELWGRVTESSFSVIFPASGDLLPRHPSQLYEAFFEGFISLLIIFYLIYKKSSIKINGLTSAIWVCLYAIFRFFIEFTREADSQVGYLILNLTMGQVLSIIMLISGLTFSYFSIKKT